MTSPEYRSEELPCGRYAIVRCLTGAVYDDNNGHGYRTSKDAEKAWSARNGKERCDDRNRRIKKRVRRFAGSHPGLMDAAAEAEARCRFKGADLSTRILEHLFIRFGIDFSDLEFTLAEFKRCTRM